MKNIALSFLCLFVLVSVSHAQKIYFRAGAGYAFPVATQTIGENYISTYDFDTQEETGTTETVSGSFGSGVNFSIAGGYMFSKYLGVDLSVQYLKGKKYEMTEMQEYIGTLNGRYDRSQTLSSTAIFINPALIIAPCTGSRVPYARFGVIIGSPKITGEEHSYYDLDGTEEEDIEFEYTKSPAIGFQGAIGFNWMIANSLDIFAEVNFISMAWHPGEYEITKYLYNGDDVLDDVSVQYKKVVFKKKIDLAEDQDPDEPSQELRENLAFSSISLQVGIRFVLGERSVD